MPAQEGSQVGRSREKAQFGDGRLPGRREKLGAEVEGAGELEVGVAGGEADSNKLPQLIAPGAETGVCFRRRAAPKALADIAEGCPVEERPLPLR